MFYVLCFIRNVRSFYWHDKYWRTRWLEKWFYCRCLSGSKIQQRKRKKKSDESQPIFVVYYIRWMMSNSGAQSGSMVAKLRRKWRQRKTKCCETLLVVDANKSRECRGIRLVMEWLLYNLINLISLYWFSFHSSRFNHMRGLNELT